MNNSFEKALSNINNTDINFDTFLNDYYNEVVPFILESDNLKWDRKVFGDPETGDVEASNIVLSYSSPKLDKIIKEHFNDEHSIYSDGVPLVVPEYFQSQFLDLLYDDELSSLEDKFDATFVKDESLLVSGLDSNSENSQTSSFLLNLVFEKVLDSSEDTED